MRRSHACVSLSKLTGILLFVLLFTSVVHAQITPSADAYIETTKPTTNYGGATTLGVLSPSQTTYITFDLSSIPSGYTGSNLAKASLKLYVNTVTTAGSFNVDYVNGTWSEKTIDANNAPPPGTTIAASVPLAKTQAKDYVVIDVTTAVEAWLNGTETNYGIALVANSPFSATFDSKENTTTSHPAELDIVFAGGGTITGVLTGSGSGLTGGGTSGTLNLSLLNTCAANQVLEWSGSAWACAAVGTGTITGVTAGTDLTGGGTRGNVTLNLDTTKVPQLGAANTFTNNVTITAAGTTLTASGGTTGFSASGTTTGVSASGTQTGVYGSGGIYGVFGYNNSGGIGVEGDGGGSATGVYATSATGNALYAVSGSGYGVLAEGGTTGVYSSGGSYGVFGQGTGNANPTGVLGQGTTGVYGIGSFQGVYGDGNTYGVYGSGGHSGVYGIGGPTGVYGSGTNYGLYGTSASGYGVYGTAGNYPAAQLVNNSGTYFTMQIANLNSAGYLFFASNASGNGCNIDGSGDLYCTGSTDAVVPTEGGQRKVALSAIQSPQNWFEDFGSEQLSNGVAVVRLEPEFVQTVSTELEYHVFLTPNGDCKGLYVSQKSSASFEVHELGGGTSNVRFDYRIVALRKNFENIRLADHTNDPSPMKMMAERNTARQPEKQELRPPSRTLAPPVMVAPIAPESEVKK